MTDTNERVEALEARITSFEAKLTETNTLINKAEKFAMRLHVDQSVTTEGLRRKLKTVFDLMRSQKKWAEAESDLLGDTRNEIMKLTEVYYHVFPERLAQDMRVVEQMSAAKPVTKRATPEKKR